MIPPEISESLHPANPGLTCRHERVLRFGSLQGKISVPEDRYLLSEPAEVLAELYGEDECVAQSYSSEKQTVSR